MSGNKEADLAVAEKARANYIVISPASRLFLIKQEIESYYSQYGGRDANEVLSDIYDIIVAEVI